MGITVVRKPKVHCKTGECKITCDGCRYPVPEAKLPADASKISEGNDCLRFPQVTCGNLPAHAGNIREAFIVRVRADFLKPRNASFDPVPKTLTEVTLAVFEVIGKPFKSDSVPKKLDRSLLALESVIQKTFK